ncbi:MAG: manganese efflux pump [Lentimicrobiaceae bacterium]|nr:manganese efflux pump [Lentimicrobiaceae bacterium]
MSLFSLILLSIALSLDCFTVCLIFGMQRSAWKKSLKKGEKDPFPPLVWNALQASGIFALFHILLIVAGWLLGWSMNAIVARYDHWLAFGLLAGIGLKTFIDGFSSKDSSIKVHAMFEWKSMLLLALAVSIDAFAVGVSMQMVQVPLFRLCTSVAITVFLFSFIGMAGGYFAHRQMQKMSIRTVNIIGGIVLIGIGVRILISHLYA